MAEADTEGQDGECVRTNVVLDERLVREAMELTGIETKREVLDEALRMLVKIKGQRVIHELRGTVEWEGDLAELRRDRFPNADR